MAIPYAGKELDGLHVDKVPQRDDGRADGQIEMAYQHHALY